MVSIVWGTFTPRYKVVEGGASEGIAALLASSFGGFNVRVLNANPVPSLTTCSSMFTPAKSPEGSPVIDTFIGASVDCAPIKVGSTTGKGLVVPACWVTPPLLNPTTSLAAGAF